jgi:hypothetical protein
MIFVYCTYVFVVIPLLWLAESLLPRGGVAALTSVVLLTLSSGSISVRGEPHPLQSCGRDMSIASDRDGAVVVVVEV